MNLQDTAWLLALGDSVRHLVEHRVAVRLGAVDWEAEPAHEGARQLGRLLSSVASWERHAPTVAAGHGDASPAPGTPDSPQHAAHSQAVPVPEALHGDRLFMGPEGQELPDGGHIHDTQTHEGA